MANVKVKSISTTPFQLPDGRVVYPGEVVEVDAAYAKLLAENKFAEPVKVAKGKDGGKSDK